MASKFGGEEDDKDSLTCGICLEFYDVDKHLPKFLECFHSCCITCLKSFVTSIVSCPFCRHETKIKNGVEKMTTNFYIMPQVHKIVAKRKNIEETIAKTKDNWAEAVSIRREVLEKFKMVQDCLKLIEATINGKAEDNHEKIAILQSLLDDTSSKKDFDELLHMTDLLEKDCQESKQELSAAQTLYNNIMDIEKYFCTLSLKTPNKENNYQIDIWKKKALTFSKKSLHGSNVGAFQPVLCYMLLNMKEQQLWKQTSNDFTEKENGQACEFVPNGIHHSTSSSTSLDVSTSESESSSVHNQTCYMGFSINGIVQPKVVFSLDFDEAPTMSQHFMDYCQGVDTLSYRSTRIFMAKGGEYFTGGNYEDLEVIGNGTRIPERSNRYLADHSTLDELKGALRMRHRGRCEGGVFVSSEFSVICRDHATNNQMTTVFGYVIKGMDVCEKISRTDPNENDIIIDECGIWPIETKKSRAA